MRRGSSTVVAIAGIAAGLAVILVAVAIYKHNQPKVTCHWQVPLKASYQTCSDGTTKEVKQ